jgi:hypothetical protein
MKQNYLYLWVGQGMKQTYLYLLYPFFQGDRSTSYLDLHLEIKDTTDTDRSASYLDLHLEIVSFISRCRSRFEADLSICGILYFKV